eukprot:97076_1
MGNREEVCKQICQLNVNENILFNNSSCNDVDIDDDTKDLILSLLTRERKNRLGCFNASNQNKKRNKKHDNRTDMGIEEIMRHKFFECIWNKKNKDYQFTWNNIRKRQHKAAPILRHLATRDTDSPRERMLDEDLDHPMHNFNDWKDEYDFVKKDDEHDTGLDTTDDEEEEEYSVDDDDDDNDEDLDDTDDPIPSTSKSGGNGTPLPVQQGNDDNNMDNHRLSPIPQSPPFDQSSFAWNNGQQPQQQQFAQSPQPSQQHVQQQQQPGQQQYDHVHKSSVYSAIAPTQHMNYPPPPQQSPNYQPQHSPLNQVNQLNPNQMQAQQFQNSPRSPSTSHSHHTNNNNNNQRAKPQPISSVTPIAQRLQQQKRDRPKGARHRKQLSSKMSIIPSKPLPPAPPNKPNTPTQFGTNNSSNSNSNSFGDHNGYNSGSGRNTPISQTQQNKFNNGYPLPSPSYQQQQQSPNQQFSPRQQQSPYPPQQQQQQQQ